MTDGGGDRVSFTVGDEVIAVHDIGGFKRARVKRSTRGVVVALNPWGELEVHFGDRVELVTADTITRA